MVNRNLKKNVHTQLDTITLNEKELRDLSVFCASQTHYKVKIHKISRKKNNSTAQRIYRSTPLNTEIS